MKCFIREDGGAKSLSANPYGLSDDPIKLARGERGFIFPYFSRILTGNIWRKEFDICAFTEALKTINQFQQKCEEREQMRDALQADLDYMEGLRKKGSGISAEGADGDEELPLPVLAGDPRWELLNAYTGCMLGNPAISVLADAYIKGIRGYDAEEALKYALLTQERSGNGARGYTPGNLSKTLEYAYTDWCLARLLEALGHPQEEVERHDRRAQAYRNVWCDSVHWFRTRLADGTWMPWRGRTVQNQGTTESNPYQQGLEDPILDPRDLRPRLRDGRCGALRQRRRRANVGLVRSRRDGHPSDMSRQSPLRNYLPRIR